MCRQASSGQNSSLLYVLFLLQAVRRAAPGISCVHGSWLAAAPYVRHVLRSRHTGLQAGHAGSTLCRATPAVQRHV
jgi:hypothetical protein